ncbi:MULTISPECIES: PepSY domain-containing protein [unclassified Streptomyces]|uniref:PepSY domain-containing protein n=1 Tax=unclassified Streptomyces TaxID=2593676 RepID=UPI00227033E6|nr:MULTISPECIES: PepSY domain-containing protein [unclassified Streptomyces]MCY0917266.1 PepSY domain-containing protein [Streptomyces sp. H27-G5]MCY0957580.1 PepSY domain-containing protein [Streptomyces sp. H27-H5]
MKRNVIISAAAAAVLTVGGPTAAVLAATGDTARTTTTATAARADVTAESASAAALKHHPGVVESLDKDGAVWHVNVIAKNGKNTEVEVDSAGKATTRDTDDDNGKEYAPLIAAKVDAKKAMAAALAANKGAKVWSADWDDDDDNGSTYWDIEVRASDGSTKHVHVDPTSGKATASTSDSGDDNDDDN